LSQDKYIFPTTYFPADFHLLGYKEKYLVSCPSILGFGGSPKDYIYGVEEFEVLEI